MLTINATTCNRKASSTNGQKQEHADHMFARAFLAYFLLCIPTALKQNRINILADMAFTSPHPDPGMCYLDSRLTLSFQGHSQAKLFCSWTQVSGHPGGRLVNRSSFCTPHQSRYAHAVGCILCCAARCPTKRGVDLGLLSCTLLCSTEEGKQRAERMISDLGVNVPILYLHKSARTKGDWEGWYICQCEKRS